MVKRKSSGISDKDWYEKSRHLTRSGSHREAIEALNLAINKNPLYAEAYFVRGVCHYTLGSCRQAAEDLDAAALLGCQVAQFWSKYAIYPLDKDVDCQEE